MTFNRLRNEVPKWWKDFENATDDLKKRVQDHIYLYLKMWDPNSGYTIRVCKVKTSFKRLNTTLYVITVGTCRDYIDTLGQHVFYYKYGTIGVVSLNRFNTYMYNTNIYLKYRHLECL